MLPARGRLGKDARAPGPTVACSAKKKGGKKPAGSEDSWQASSEAPLRLPPPRITDTSQFSLKKQLRFVRTIRKEAERSAAAPAARSSFRRKKEIPKPEVSCTDISQSAQDEAVLRKGKGLKALYNSKGWANPPAVLVDGYNVLLRWLAEPGEEARKARIGCDLELGRQELLRDLAEYASWHRLRLMVAFDAQGNLEAPLIARDNAGGVEVVFVRGEADSFIIGEAGELRKAGAPFVLVASSDNDIRDSCWTNEVFPVHAMQLLRDVKKAKEAAERFYRETHSRGRGGQLGNVLMRANPALASKLNKARVAGVEHLGQKEEPDALLNP